MCQKLNPQRKKQNKTEKDDSKLLTELQSLKISLDKISKWKDNFSRDSPRLARQNNKLPHRCSACSQKNQKCNHSYFCGSDEHFQAGCNKRMNSLKNKKTLKDVAPIPGKGKIVPEFV